MAGDHLGPRSLRQLLDTVLAIGSELDLDAALRRIVEGAVSLVDARYGALGVLDESGTRLAQFVTVGLDDEQLRAIGDLPKGLGVLGSLIVDARPLRVPALDEHPDSAGFPPDHPRMTSFLGVPIVARGEVFGNLYLTDKTSAEAFSDLDEQLAIGLASAAGIVIENARLYGQSRRREAAISAVHEIMATAVAGVDGRTTLQLIADRARELVGADSATFARPSSAAGMLVIDVVSGAAADLVGHVFPAAGSVSGEVIETGEPIVLTDASQDHRVSQPQVRAGEIGPAVWVALSAFGERVGTLGVARPVGAQAFSDGELEFVRLFATQAALVLELDRSREDLLRLSVLEDQERIARDLHDTVIQRLFAIGLSLQSAGRLSDNEAVSTRMTTAVDDLDATVRHIRTAIFGLERLAASAPADLRRRALDMAAEAARSLGFEPQVTFDGPLDTMVPPARADELLAVLREALSNVSRHASARHVSIELTLAGRELCLTVADDGVGLGPARTGPGSGGRGLANMAARAADLGGTMNVTSGVDGRGVQVTWSVPI